MHDWKVGDTGKYIEENQYGSGGEKLIKGSEHIIAEVKHIPCTCGQCTDSGWFLRPVGFHDRAWCDADWFIPVTKGFEEPKMRVKEDA